MVVGIGEILILNKKCTIVVGLLLIFTGLIMIPCQADADGFTDRLNKMYYTSTQSVDEVNITLEGHLGGLIEACAVSGNYAFIGKGQDFVVLDISNPAAPSELDKLITSGFVNDISISGDYAYVVNRNGQLVIVDISNPTDPVLVGHYDTPVHPEFGRIPALGIISIRQLCIYSQ